VYSLENHAGRLLELRFAIITTSDEHLEISERIIAHAERLGRRVVIATDNRATVHLPPSLQANIGRGMRAANPSLERSAILMPKDILREQLARVVRDANSPVRRVFRSANELKAWLAEVLDAGERARLDAFIADD
jgi:hypothetical protein